MNENAWFKTYYKILDWEWYKDVYTKSVFFHLILKANVRDKRAYGVIVNRGQLITSRLSLSKELGISQQNVRTALRHLVSSGEITIEPMHDFSRITILNFKKYQGDDPPGKYEQNVNEKKVHKKSTSQLTSHLTSQTEPKNLDSSRAESTSENESQPANQPAIQPAANQPPTSHQPQRYIVRYKDIRKENKGKGAPATQEKVKGAEQPAGPSEGYLPQYWEREIPKVFWGRFAVEDDYWEWAQAHSEEVSQAWGMS